MTKPDAFEQQLKQHYQHDKACHPLPEQIRTALDEKARQQQDISLLRRLGWQGLWRNTQLALSCALVVVMGYLLIPFQSPQQWHYQISYSQDPTYSRVQHHSVSADATPTAIALNNTADAAYQQFLAAEQGTKAFHAQTGLLQQQADYWQIRVCNDLLVTIDKQLFSQLQRSPDIDSLGQQWVEFISNPAGQLIAIRAANQALHCPHS
uniref:Uncharacterized protein n=1 Tax=Rheinheimera sp. BAL341 TaxID=1708203 RepID=A0A486XY60_9GAMM